ncbi:MAG: Unknown protein [uncultured Sulfurovum sp.]|uniref:histidine kinase n=1 Tax=uncultured Sulfurovum sp. TaxID=269237 RepID=A0A6S6SZG4_9BACT|nr:MAG: Unknown protein [uncultured Sulfurovum sp.]
MNLILGRYLEVLDDFIYTENLGIQADYTLVKQISIASLVILLLALIWINLLKIHNKKLKTIQDKLNVLNSTLEQKVQIEIEKNRKKELMMLHQSRLAQMGEVINMIAHQWRQPLSSINALVLIMDMKISKQNLKDKQFLQKELDDIEMLTQHMSTTINDFKDFFLPEKEKVLFNIQDMSNHVTSLLQPILVYENIQIKIKHDDNIEFYGYQNEFGQVLINVLNNAKDALLEKHTNKEKVIYLSTLQEEKKIIISIQDNAGGIDEKIINKIFEPYFSTKSEKKGTGLGLYMSKKIIEEHMGGRLFATNSLDGAKFTIEFDLS